MPTRFSSSEPPDVPPHEQLLSTSDVPTADTIGTEAAEVIALLHMLRVFCHLEERDMTGGGVEGTLSDAAPGLAVLMDDLARSWRPGYGGERRSDSPPRPATPPAGAGETVQRDHRAVVNTDNPPRVQPRAERRRPMVDPVTPEQRAFIPIRERGDLPAEIIRRDLATAHRWRTGYSARKSGAGDLQNPTGVRDSGGPP